MRRFTRRSCSLLWIAIQPGPAHCPVWQPARAILTPTAIPTATLAATEIPTPNADHHPQPQPGPLQR
jgi:hypothetical protein